MCRTYIKIQTDIYVASQKILTQRVLIASSHLRLLFSTCVMTSSNLHFFRVTGPLCGNSPRSFDVFFDLRLNEQLSEQSWGWWFETLSCPLWRHCNVTMELPNAPSPFFFILSRYPGRRQVVSLCEIKFILFYSILFYSILFYSILFYSSVWFLYTENYYHSGDHQK